MREIYGLRVSTITVYSVVYRMYREGLLEKINIGGESLYRLSKKGIEEFEKAMKLIEYIANILKS